MEHADPDGITVTWDGFDDESGITNFYVAVGISLGDTSVTGGYVDLNHQTTSYIKASLLKYSESGNVYYVSVKAQNGAGLSSNVMVSSPVIVLGQNIPGVVNDGRQKFLDNDMTRDTSSMAINFHGFESEICNIISYEFAIGSEPFFSDVSSFSEFGIDHNATHGWAERNVNLDEDNTYYATVRARTGHECHEEYIVSSSDGITVDSIAPQVLNVSTIQEPKNKIDGNFYQDNVDSLDILWDAYDKSGIVSVNFSVGHLPYVEDILPYTTSDDNRISPGIVNMISGESVFVNFIATDPIGNKWTGSFGQYTADNSKPRVKNFTCSDIISAKLPIINCSWVVNEVESAIKIQSIAVGSTSMADDIVAEKNISATASSWTIHLHGVTTTTIFVTLKLMNLLNLEDTFTYEIQVDITDPVIESVEIVTWTNPSHSVSNRLCQMSWSYVDARLTGVGDPDSGIFR